MSLFQEVRDLNETIAYIEDEIGKWEDEDPERLTVLIRIGGWLSELLNIKKARLAIDMFLESPEVVMPDDAEVFARCSCCGREVYDWEDIPAGHNLPGVTDGPECICEECWQKSPEKYMKKYAALMRQMADGEYDIPEDATCCQRCGSQMITESVSGVLYCEVCGMQINEGEDGG